MIRRFPIVWRLVFMFALTAAVVFSGVAYILYCVLGDAVIKQVRAELEFHHSLIDQMMVDRHTPGEWAEVRRKLNGLAEAGGRVRYWIDSPDSRYAYGTEPYMKESWRGVDSRFGFAKGSNPGQIWCVLSKVIPAFRDRPAVDFIVALDASPYMHTKQSFIRVMAIAFGLGILLVAILAYWIAKLGLHPVRALGRQAHALQPNNPRERLEVDGLPREIRELAVSFNNALARREAAWLQLEGFNADVAHELRTPLTNLIGQTQVALIRERDLNVLTDLLESNLEELERMSGMVNDMLFLSSAENGHRAAELSDVSLRAEAKKTAEYLEEAFLQRGMAVHVSGDAQARIDRRLFHRALGNLLSNSARYGYADTEVIVSIETQGAHVVVSVADSGDPIPPDQQARLFERFYRGDKARTGSGQHHGLGLSIVRAVASMHGGDVFVSSEHGTNVFGFSLLKGYGAH